MIINSNLQRKEGSHILKTLLLLFMMAATLNVSAQPQSNTETVSLQAKALTRQNVIDAIEAQTGCKVIYNVKSFDQHGTVNFGKTTLPLTTVLDKLTEGTGQHYSFDNGFILIHKGKAGNTISGVTLAANRTLAGTVNDTATGQPMEGVTVELVNLKDKQATAFSNGRFSIEDVPSGSHIVKLTSADGSSVRYREITVPSGGDADVEIDFGGDMLRRMESTDDTADIAAAVKTTAYFVPNAADNTIRAFSDEVKSEYSFVPTGRIENNYMPKAAVKTNLLYLATTTPNIAVEFGLAKKWTLDIAAGLNPWDLNGNKGGIRHGLIQPELRYWFCQRFEKHFIGLHGIYGQYQIQNIDLKPFGNDLTGKRYDGWGAGAGISYGYHFPMSKRWAWEFTVGVGYIYLDYDKYNCGECSNKIGSRQKHYFGPTKAGISLIFMIK